ncbi:MAG: prepilin-type N-terminal cleavage/methylation domain-containing protein [Verrucomicrobia bacterium]|nr:prepilin-type N-terminal cleavage/methylation domain-containing protein [Verrucomicrobiota bacterium]
MRERAKQNQANAILLKQGPGNAARAGFTLIELLVVLAIIGILAAMLLPSLSRARGAGLSISCVNNLKQFGLSAMMYADENDGEFPRRSSPSWMETLKPNYRNYKILRCPADPVATSAPGSAYEGHRAPRSYLYNGWSDYFQTTLSPEGWQDYSQYKHPHGLRQSAIPFASDTILFGEKDEESAHVHMDTSQDNDPQELEQTRHNKSGTRGGSSNYLFTDGSVRAMKFGKSLWPINMWAVTEFARTNLAITFN